MSYSHLSLFFFSSLITEKLTWGRLANVTATRMLIWQAHLQAVYNLQPINHPDKQSRVYHLLSYKHFIHTQIMFFPTLHLEWSVIRRYPEVEFGVMLMKVIGTASYSPHDIISVDMYEILCGFSPTFLIGFPMTVIGRMNATETHLRACLI